MEIQTTQEYFSKNIDQLLELKDNGYTKEECLLFDDGLNVTFFDDMKEYKEEFEEFNKWRLERELEIKTILETINGRVAAILI